jgi:tRNA threonylcarbamoyl adenosine modification protein (Sua5/YciO/YrdC/YwlC family)
MSAVLAVHPVDPQPRFLRQAADVVREGGVIVYPTDSCYAFGCQIGNKAARERIGRIRRLDEKHRFALLCRDLSELSVYANFSTPVYRLLKAHTPGPYAFLLRGTREAPRLLMDPKRKRVGVRVPDHRIALALLEELNEPMMTSSLILPGDDLPLTDPEEIAERIGSQVDLILDGGIGSAEPTTMVDLTEDVPRVVRVGRGDPTPFL